MANTAVCVKVSTMNLFIILDAIYASCMRNVVAGIDLNDLRALLVKSRESVLNSRSGLETASSGILYT